MADVLPIGVVVFPGTASSTTSPVPLAGLFGLAAVLEFAGSAVLLFGLVTRSVTFLLSGEMAVAYLMVHAPQGFSRCSMAVSWRSSAVSRSATSPRRARGRGASTLGVSPDARLGRPRDIPRDCASGEKLDGDLQRVCDRDQAQAPGRRREQLSMVLLILFVLIVGGSAVFGFG